MPHSPHLQTHLSANNTLRLGTLIDKMCGFNRLAKSRRTTAKEFRMKMTKLIRNIPILPAICAGILTANIASAEDSVQRINTTANTSGSLPIVSPAAPQVPAKAYVLVDTDSGQVIASNHAGNRTEPASLTKLMTLYIVSKSLEDGRIHMDDDVLVSTHAWKMTGSRMFIEPGKYVKVRDLIQGVIVESGNDATVALAEHIGGSEEAFVSLMNQYAKTLGMDKTHFTNSTGLPDPQHYTTASDLAVLSYHVSHDFPEYYAWYSQKTFSWNHITQHNRNRLLWHDSTVDGMKTGHTDKAGYCLIASSHADNTRLIAVVLGADSDKNREVAAEKLLKFGDQFYETDLIIQAQRPMSTVRTWGGKRNVTQLGVDNNVYVTIPRGAKSHVRTKIILPEKLEAPVSQHQDVAKAQIYLDDKLITETNLLALTNNDRANAFTRAIDRAAYWIDSLFN